MDRYRIAALLLAVALLFAAATVYIPAFIDSEGRVFGLFHLDIYKDALHVASGIWALAAATSRRAAVFFLRVFGTLCGRVPARSRRQSPHSCHDGGAARPRCQFGRRRWHG